MEMKAERTTKPKGRVMASEVTETRKEKTLLPAGRLKKPARLTQAESWGGGGGGNQ